MAGAPDARAEYALLRNGQRLHITGYERLGEMLRLQMAGGYVDLAAAEVAAFEPEEVFPTVRTPAPAEPFGGLIRAAAVRHGLDEELVVSVISAESKFNPRAVSRRRALGLMQLTSTTAARFGVADLFDPRQNIEAGTRYLKELLGRYNHDLRLALAAYNAGPERVDAYGGVPPYRETRDYVTRVTKLLTSRKARSLVLSRRTMPCPPAFPSPPTRSQ